MVQLGLRLEKIVENVQKQGLNIFEESVEKFSF